MNMKTWRQVGFPLGGTHLAAALRDTRLSGDRQPANNIIRRAPSGRYFSSRILLSNAVYRGSSRMGSYWGKTRTPVISHADRASYAFSRRMARPVVLSSDQQEILEARARARSAPARSVERARIVLLAAAGLQDQ